MIEERYYLAQSCIEARKIKGGGRKGESFQNIFYKLLKCDYCGGKVHMVNKGGVDKPLRYFICYNSTLKHGCKSFHWSYREFEQQFFQFIKDDSFDELLRFDENASHRKKLEDKIFSIEGKIKKHNLNINNLIDLDSSLNEQDIPQISQKISNISKQIEQLKSEKTKYRNELNQLILRDSSNAKQELLESIESIEKSLDADAQISFRKHINTVLRRYIDNIGISYTYEEYDDSITPFENLSFITRNRLKNQGITDNTVIKKMFFNT